ncbi:uncharacterized protein LOC131154074 [Malania oleifera]|uniref:uncharacterized protein LOC131154074 n=1 Tax=Malania oleifera TaxID=397392 RepID=UPI0025AE8BDD|nr:uncharacterized protein LOC131154074 [Malania oleifera]
MASGDHLPTMAWDLNSLGVLNTHMSMSMSMSSTLALMDSNSNGPYAFSSSVDDDSDLSTGYLQDALVEFSGRAKRRPLLLCGDDDRNHHCTNDIRILPYWYWNSNRTWDLSEKFNCMSQTTSTTLDEVSGEPINTWVSCRLGRAEEAAAFTDVKTPDEAMLAPETVDSSSSSYKVDPENTNSASDKATLFSIVNHPLPAEGGGDEDDDEDEMMVMVMTKRQKKKKKKKRVVYPFAVVKPGGREGDVTLNDINERILMPPTRPLRHPVGDFACRPCVSAHGLGLSGKAVVALTRIHTQGRGTITIIRTRG